MPNKIISFIGSAPRSEVTIDVSPRSLIDPKDEFKVEVVEGTSSYRVVLSKKVSGSWVEVASTKESIERIGEDS